MITKFDKNGIAEHFKTRFAECLDEEDFEGAIDYLLKFSDECDNPEFHLALGMLYLLMVQDSDDNELLTLAFREFMMHIRLYPDCDAAYRNLLATVILREDPQSIIECIEWIKSRGGNLDEYLLDIGEAGIDILGVQDYGIMDIEAMYEPGEFGTIESGLSRDEAQSADEAPQPSAPHKNKIIAFAGGAATDDSDREAKRCDVAESPIEFEFDVPHGAMRDGTDKTFADDDDERLYEISRAILDTIEADAEAAFDYNAGTHGYDNVRKLMEQAEKYFGRKDYDKALAALDKIRLDEDPFYYSALAMRAYILMEAGRYPESDEALKAALEIRKNGALAGTLLCRLYELTGQYDKIPDVLKQTDVTDFVDCDHVYRAFKLAIEYCTAKDAIALAEKYIEEYNVMDMRRLYAQLLYNSGEKKRAADELYKLSRIFYDDFNAMYYYLSARSDVTRMPVDEEAPQDVIGAIVENLMLAVARSELDEEFISSDIFAYSLEFFLTLEYHNSRKLVVSMFDTLRKLSVTAGIEDKMLDALVSPYVEPIVKAVILAGLYSADNTRSVYLELSYSPVTVSRAPLGNGYSQGYYAAFALYVTLARGSAESFAKIAKKAKSHLKKSGRDEKHIAYYVFKKAWDEIRPDAAFDERVVYALGFSSKAEAVRAFAEIEKSAGAKK